MSLQKDCGSVFPAVEIDTNCLGGKMLEFWRGNSRYLPGYRIKRTSCYRQCVAFKIPVLKPDP